MKLITRLNILTLLLFFAVISVTVFITNETASAAQGLTVPQSSNQPYSGDIQNNPIIKWIEFFVNVLSVIIVAGSAVMIAYAGVQYSAARDNPQQVQAAKQKMWNVGIGLLSYFFLYAFIQWIIPGGVF